MQSQGLFLCLFLDNSLYNLQQSVKVLQLCAQKCTLLDEISLEANMYYDCGKDYIVGLQDFDSKQHFVMKPMISHLALMIGGLICKWKQPVDFSLANESTRSVSLDTSESWLETLVAQLQFQVIEDALHQLPVE